MVKADDASGAGAIELDVSGAADQMEALLGDEDNDQAGAGEHSAQAEADEAEQAEEAEAADEEGNEDQAEEQPRYKVRIDGEDQEVTLDELVRGYQREGDYTRKTQALAEQRRTQQAEFDAVRAEREQYGQLLQTLDSRLQELLPAEPNWEVLQRTDPIGFATQWASWQRVQQERGMVQQEMQRLAQQNAADQAVQLRARLKSEAEELVKVIPSWSDPAKAKEERAALVEYGAKLGFTPDELNSIYDHRAVAVLHRAWKYDQLLQKRQAATAKIQAAPRVLAPGAANTVPRRTTELTKAKQRLAQTGSVQDAAGLFEKFL